jgi:ribulose-phosphate 3-epimerase
MHTSGRPILIAPSLLAADFANLASAIREAEDGGADLLHLDVMDGHFVPNISIGPPVIASVRKASRLPLDAHLMISEPGRYVDAVVAAGANWVSVHVEADPHLDRTVAQIRELGAIPGVALNPATPLGTLEEILPQVGFVLVMTVNPGFGGQEFVPSTLAKIRRLRAMVAAGGHHVSIEVDGGIGAGNLPEILEAGANVIVAGSSVFRAACGTTGAVREMKEVAARHAGRLVTA